LSVRLSVRHMLVLGQNDLSYHEVFTDGYPQDCSCLPDEIHPKILKGRKMRGGTEKFRLLALKVAIDQ